VRTRNITGLACAALLVSALAVGNAAAQEHAPLPPLPAPLSVPQPGPQTDAPYAPQPILQGGIVIPLFPPGSPYLNKDKVNIPEKYNMSGSVAGRIGSIVHIHNPSIEVHLVDGGMNTGAAVILIAGGGHNTLNVGGEGADFVPYFIISESTPSSCAAVCAATGTTRRPTRSTTPSRPFAWCARTPKTGRSTPIRSV